MKLRYDFVTNSSSASFIVAIHDTASHRQIVDTIRTSVHGIESIVTPDFLRFVYDAETFLNTPIGVDRLEHALEYIVSGIIDSATMHLDNWKVGYLYTMDGDDDLLLAFFNIFCPTMDTSVLKIDRVD